MPIRSAAYIQMDFRMNLIRLFQKDLQKRGGDGGAQAPR